MSAADLIEDIPHGLAGKTQRLELASLVAQLLQHSDKPRVQNQIASQLYVLGARHMLANMMNERDEVKP